MNNKVKFLRGTATEYEASTKDNDTFYYTTDDEKLYLGNKEITGGGVTIDNALSDTSKNPVQNKVINAALNSKANLSDIPTELPANGGNADTLGNIPASELERVRTAIIGGEASGNQWTAMQAKKDDTMIRVQVDTDYDRVLLFKSIDGGVTWTEIPLGNADTLDGKHASNFVQNLTTWKGVSVKDQLLKTTQSGFVWIDNTCTDLPDVAVNWWYGIVIHTVSHYQLIITDISNLATYVLSYNAGTTPPRFYDWRNLSDGGNATTVNGLTVQTAVPANAKFTDTTYPAASTSAAGLVSTGAQTLAGNKTFNGQIIPAGASAVGTAQARKIYAGTSDMTAGATALETGAIYLVYE